MVGTFKSMFRGGVAPPSINHILSQMKWLGGPEIPEEPRRLRLGEGPVNGIPKGSWGRRVGAWEVDPDNPNRLRAFHYTKGWRYQRNPDEVVS
jgi:hypothetical protein